jgi:hypothetical protein
MLLILGVGGMLGNPACDAAGADDLDRSAQLLVKKYRDQLEQLAQWCDGRGLKEQAQKTRKWLRPREPVKFYVAVLPDKVGRPALPEGASDDVAKWDADLAKLQSQYAAACYELSRRAVRSGRPSLAFDLILAAIHEDPDHEAARRLLGYQQFRGQWCTQDQVNRLRNGQVWHERFGWISKSYVSRYENGQRYANGRWISAEEDARLHRDIRNGWEVQTEHYTIRTDHSLEAGVELGTKLERLYGVWKQLFLRYYLSDAQVATMFEGRSRARRGEPPRHQVAYFRDRDDYNQNLRTAIPNIEISIGLYLDSTRRAYFFAGKDADDRTLYHEATHQLFHESRPVAPDVARAANFWVVEGIAMYMESLHEEDGFHVLGGWNDLRLHAAQYRLLHDKFYVPLSEFTAYGMEQLQSDRRIATLYSQAAGLTHFLIYYDNGRYRDALVQYLSLIYSSQADANTLAKLTGASYSELDKQYRQFLEAGRESAEKP